jgi:hypothetical protein
VNCPGETGNGCAYRVLHGPRMQVVLKFRVRSAAGARQYRGHGNQGPEKHVRASCADEEEMDMPGRGRTPWARMQCICTLLERFVSRLPISRFFIRRLFVSLLAVVMLVLMPAHISWGQVSTTGQWQTLPTQMPINPVHVLGEPSLRYKLHGWSLGARDQHRLNPACAMGYVLQRHDRPAGWASLHLGGHASV